LSARNVRFSPFEAFAIAFAAAAALRANACARKHLHGDRSHLNERDRSNLNQVVDESISNFRRA
jgi:hypothetical protein